MKNSLILLFLFFGISNYSQIKGNITDKDGSPISFVTISIENTYANTASGPDGIYFLNLKSTGDYTLIFKHIGYKPQKVRIAIPIFPHILNIKMEREETILNEVVINTKGNPANAIIRNAIEHRIENMGKTSRFRADFYSKKILKTDAKADKIDIIDFDGPYHDTIPNGIAYLSETQSKIVFEKPNRIKETILASKVSGFKDEFSANYASAWNFDFYDNFIAGNLVSPIAKNAFSYYKYKLEGTFFDENNQMITKIGVTPKKEKSPTFDGYIYIVEDSWAIYAIDLNINGHRVNLKHLVESNIKQNFSYNKSANLWAKSSQTEEYTTDRFGNKIFGKVTNLFSNYEFVNKFDKDEFTSQISSFADDSNKQDSAYWESNRPIALTEEERQDYRKMDSIITARDSAKLTWVMPKKTLITNKKHGLFPPFFNTVQGWNLSLKPSFTLVNKYSETETSFLAGVNYGFSEQRVRFIGIVSHLFNKKTYSKLIASGGTEAVQFNPDSPITEFINTVSSLFFEDNYMKLYNKEFAKLIYSRFLFNGSVNFRVGAEYEQRKALFNNTDLVWVKNDDNYTSNNPLLPNDYVTPPFETYYLTKASLSAIINFGNRYIARPDKNVFMTDFKYPIIYLDYYNAFLANSNNYNHQFFSAKIDYHKILGVYGNWSASLGSGKFIHSKDITFADYKHFNGNRTHIGYDNKYMGVFNFMPYYTNSTNDSYAELHTEYNDKSYLFSNIMGLNNIGLTINLGYHLLSVPDFKPYSEYTAGLQYKGFRLDYIRSYQDGFSGDGVIFGINFLGKNKFLNTGF